MNDLERRQRRLDRARFWIRAELFFAVAVPVVIGLLFITAPGTMGPPMFANPPTLLELLPLVGVLGLCPGPRLDDSTVTAQSRGWRARLALPRLLT